MKKFLIAVALAAAPLSFALTAPAFAQASSYDPGSYWDVTGVKFAPGGAEAYMDFLQSNWKKQQEFAKSKGWIEDYMVLANNYARDGESDIYLMIKYKSVPDAAEQMREAKAFEDFMKMDPHQLDASNGDRAKMRTIKENMQFQELKLK